LSKQKPDLLALRTLRFISFAPLREKWDNENMQSFLSAFLEKAQTAFDPGLVSCKRSITMAL
jgi:hypothetical protein